ncbi:TDP-N-acetylfucosamine:lipid II N-acetylfucosaminyltransferase [Photobacterium leiognathi]|uniref:TDP-N-acetylfucosamine:lipid II N-acetylfucosaminyltransferase n=1 Tax=Photobacterium leiognathi TaxID=553611 RepID=UPI00273867B1|nr:TDP-N-acetylfucosamine:lipid II N-acetylfucosaminyltransferase [Photobacterium leiognathi]
MTRILHVMGQFPEKYNSKFYDFFENNFNYKSLYLPLVIKDGHYSSNVIKLKQNFFSRVCGLIKNILFSKNDMIIFHGFFFNWKYLIVINFLLSVLNKRKIFIWEVWGGDLYFYKNKKK